MLCRMAFINVEIASGTLSIHMTGKEQQAAK